MLMCVYKSVRLLGNDVIYRDKERIVLARNWHLIEEKDGDSILDTETCFMLSHDVQTEWARCLVLLDSPSSTRTTYQQLMLTAHVEGYLAGTTTIEDCPQLIDKLATCKTRAF